MLRVLRIGVFSKSLFGITAGRQPTAESVEALRTLCAIDPLGFGSGWPGIWAQLLTASRWPELFAPDWKTRLQVSPEAVQTVLETYSALARHDFISLKKMGRLRMPRVQATLESCPTVAAPMPPDFWSSLKVVPIGSRRFQVQGTLWTDDSGGAGPRVDMLLYDGTAGRRTLFIVGARSPGDT
jgi:hypothetical protein